MSTNNDFKDYGNLSAVEPVYSRRMYCRDCKVTWIGCWDNFMCPECGQGELPSFDISLIFKSLFPCNE